MYDIDETILMDVYPDWMVGGGIFTDLQNYDVPWKSENINGMLDLAYYGNHSGGKIISPLVERMRGTDNVLSAEARANIARTIFTICGANWGKLWSTLSLEYNPIENVDAYLTETTDTTGGRNTTDTIKSTGTDIHSTTGTDTVNRTGTDTHDTTGNETTDRTGTDTTAETGTDTVKRSGTDAHATTGTETTDHTGTVTTDGTTDTTRNTENGIAGFNSGSYSDSDNQTMTENVKANTTETRATKDATTSEGSDTETVDLQDATTYGKTDTETLALKDATDRTGQDKETVDLQDVTTYGRTDTETKDLQDDHTGTETSTGKVEHTLHRHGNIGVTTSQQMITAERELWNWYFYDVVFADIDKYLATRVY